MFLLAIIFSSIFQCSMFCRLKMSQVIIIKNWQKKNSLLQQYNSPKNQLQFTQAAERMRIKLRGPVEHSPWKPNPNIFADPGYANINEIFVYFQMSNSQWRGARRILLFSGVFLYMTWTICGLNFVVLRPPLHDFSQKNPKNIPNIWLFWQIKTYGTKFG